VDDGFGFEISMYTVSSDTDDLLPSLNNRLCNETTTTIKHSVNSIDKFIAVQSVMLLLTINCHLLMENIHLNPRDFMATNLDPDWVDKSGSVTP
jgi:hypothetical protein